MQIGLGSDFQLKQNGNGQQEEDFLTLSIHGEINQLLDQVKWQIFGKGGFHIKTQWRMVTLKVHQ